MADMIVALDACIEAAKARENFAIISEGGNFIIAILERFVTLPDIHSLFKHVAERTVFICGMVKCVQFQTCQPSVF